MLFMLYASAAFDPVLQPELSRPAVEAYLSKLLSSPVVRDGAPTPQTWGQALTEFATTIRSVFDGEVDASTVVGPDLFPNGSVNLDRPLKEVLTTLAGELRQRAELDQSAQQDALEKFRDRKDLPAAVTDAVDALLVRMKKSGHPGSNYLMTDIAEALHNAGQDPYAVSDLMAKITRRPDATSGIAGQVDWSAQSPANARRQAAGDLERVAKTLGSGADAETLAKGVDGFGALKIEDMRSPLNALGPALRDLAAFLHDEKSLTVLELARRSTVVDRVDP